MAAKNIGSEEKDENWHGHLLSELGGMLKDEEVKKMKHFLETVKMLTLNELGKCNDFHDVWIRLERAGKLAIGDYDELSKVMKMLKRRDCIAVIKDYKGRIEDNRAKQSRGKSLVKAAGDGDTAAVVKLLSDGAHVDYVDYAIYKNGCTALMHGSKNGHLDVVDSLLKGGAEVDKESKNGWTALMIASQFGQPDVVDVLLKGGAEVDKEEKNGCTALMIASQFGQPGVVDVLLKGGAEVDKEKKNGWTALMSASQEGHIGIVDALLKGGAEVDKEMKNGWTALMSASLHGHLDVVKTLLKGGAAINKSAQDGRLTALGKAEEYGHKEVAEFLKRSGAKR